MIKFVAFHICRILVPVIALCSTAAIANCNSPNVEQVAAHCL